MVVESVDPVWVSILGRKIEDTCLSADQCIEPYTKRRIRALTDIYSAGIDRCYVN
ncbi:hypothetical protein [Microseira wollei]|uniref:Methyl-accepting chemotaxis sensory transducer with GAF sensor n=1 Tax=Microseira wollei NIES-4236 TaxID=2530354 RepID=A0AAV3X729_9CYAN|nr:hypothetical protein [Microseira wollei]GET35890.1 methyl-accepting chemotaxis sensory transducer with GAF sensor [Microseira wollei NIES-4236]